MLDGTALTMGSYFIAERKEEKPVGTKEPKCGSQVRRQTE